MRSWIFVGATLASILGAACHSSRRVSVPEDVSPDGKVAEADADVDGGSEGSDEATDLYPEDRLLHVAIELDPDDWDAIRAEGRSLNQVFSGCADPEFAYTEVNASVVIDGERLDHVALRKKGFLGSLSDTKPSLRLLLDRELPEQALGDQKDLTLNNSRSDASFVRQCLAYGVFRAAGVPAPRCAFAQVVLNDVDLGIYINVEPVKKPFLRRHFERVDGNLYEGNSGADFRADSLGRFDKKTHESDPERNDLESLSDVLATCEDEQLEERVAELVDLDEFMLYWSVESLLGLWDGYTGNLNNFFVYHDPGSDRLVFLPWGPDAAFQRVHPFLPAGERPAITYAWGRLARRLYAYEPTRRRYHETLRHLLDTVWNEERLLTELERLTAAVGDAGDATTVSALGAFISGRRGQIESELANPDAPWTVPERALRSCTPEANVPVRARFVTQWGTFNAPPVDGNTLELAIDGEEQLFERVSVGAGPQPNPSGGPPSNSLRLVGTRADGSSLTIQFSLGKHPIEPGTIDMHGFETLGTAFQSSSFSVFGYVGEGSIVFDQASAEAGAVLEGSLEGSLVIPSRVQQAMLE